jgi:mannose/cellobiose epimerase-like protein (N-acyl-D-glucosamine 2-epimerase family)
VPVTRKAVVGWLVAAAFGAVPAHAQPEPLLQGPSWRDLVLLELIEVARQGVEYLLAHAWDERYGGWYDRLSVDSEVLDGTTDSHPYVSVGGQLTAALAYVRLYEQSGDAVYLEAARSLARVIDRGWDDAPGCWLDQVQRRPPHAAHPDAKVQWWIHIYGAFLDLRLHAIDGDPGRLRRFARAERFYRS